MKRINGVVVRCLGSAGVVVAVLLALASPAAAVLVSEPPANNDIATAFGPLSSDVVYTGQFETAGDVDWLYFYVTSGAGNVRVTVKKVGAGCSTQIRAKVHSGNGFRLPYSTIASDMTWTDEFSIAGPIRQYITLDQDPTTVSGCIGDPYEVTVSPAAGITSVAPADEEPPVPNPQPTSEPNDDVTTASGPLAASTAYGGDFASPGDRDWLVFYTTGVVGVNLTITKVGPGCGPDIIATVRPDTGGPEPRVTFVASDTTAYVRFSSTTAARYYVALASECAGNPYQVRVGPAASITTTSPLIGFAPTPTPVITGEPNESPAQASRAMGGIAYGGSIDSPLDVDYFRFTVADGRLADVSVTKVGDGCSSGLNTSVRKASTPGTAITDQMVSRNATVHHRFTSEGTTDYLLRVVGTCAGDPYQLRVDPADAIVAPPPPDGDGDGKPDDQDRCPTIAAGASSGCPPKAKPTGMTLVTLSRLGAFGPLRIRVAGSIRLPAAVPAAAACRGRVAIGFRARGRTVARATTVLRPDCKYGRTFTFANRRSLRGARRLSVTATFRGNALLRSTTRRAVARAR